MIDARFRPLPVWPHPATPADRRRSRWTFKASWAATLELLDRELRHLGARNVVIGCGLREQDIRLDGWPRAGAREPAHPGVEVSFDAHVGRLVCCSPRSSTGCAWRSGCRRSFRAAVLEVRASADERRLCGWRHTGSPGGNVRRPGASLLANQTPSPRRA